MDVRRRAGLLGTITAGLLVSVAALPAGASSSAAAPSTVGGESAECTQARAAQEDYRVDEIVPLAAEWEERLVEVEGLVAQAEADLAAAADVLEAADEAQGAAQDALTAAAEALEAAEEGGDEELIAAAQLVYDDAYQAEIDALGPVVEAEAAFYSAEEGLTSLRIERDETRARSEVLTGAALGRGFETEQQLVDYTELLRIADLDTYADLVGELAEACFAYVDEDDVEEDDASAEVPGAPAATPVVARASYTG